MIARPSRPDPLPAALEALLDGVLDDDTFDRTWDDDDAEPAALGPPRVPRALWERALLGPARDMLTRPSKRFRSTLCAQAARLSGGPLDLPARLPLLLEVIHTGSLVVDDIEDDSRERRGSACLHRLHGVPLALNTGNWMYFWPLELLGDLGLAPALEHELRRLMVRAMLRCHHGQALDLAAEVARLPRATIPGVVRASTTLKTGALTELAARVGAVAAGAAPERVVLLSRFGLRLGVALQMLDDLGNLAAADRGDGKRHEDLRRGRPTWPWAWAAQDVDDLEFAGLQAAARAVQTGADSEPLAAGLRAAVGLRGRHTARQLLQRALDDLGRGIGPAPELAALGDEIARLEASYG